MFLSLGRLLRVVIDKSRIVTNGYRNVSLLQGIYTKFSLMMKKLIFKICVLSLHSRSWILVIKFHSGAWDRFVGRENSKILKIVDPFHSCFCSCVQKLGENMLFFPPKILPIFGEAPSLLWPPLPGASAILCLVLDYVRTNAKKNFSSQNRDFMKFEIGIHFN